MNTNDLPKCVCGTATGVSYYNDRWWCVACLHSRCATLQAASEALSNERRRAIQQRNDLLAACENARECVAGRDGLGALEAVLEAAINKAKGLTQ